MRVKLRSLLTPLTTGAVLALCLSACSGTDDAQGPTDRFELELFDSTRLLDATAAKALVAVEADGTLRFQRTPALEGELRRQVLVIPPTAALPFGSIRFIGDVQEAGDELLLSSIAVPPQIAFRRLHVVARRREVKLAGQRWQRADLTPVSAGPAAPAPSLRPLDSGELGAEQVVDFFPFDADGDPSTKEDQVHVTGKLGGKIEYDFGLDVDWGDVISLPTAVADCLLDVLSSGGCSVQSLLPEVRVGYGVEAGGEASLKVEGAAFQGFSKQYTLAKVTADPIVMGPLVFFPELSVVANIDGRASSRFLVETGVAFSTGAGIAFSTKSGVDLTLPHADSSFTPPQAEVTATAYAQARVGPQVALKLYDFAGPTASVVVGVALDADAAKNPCYTVSGRGDFELGFAIGLELPGFGQVDLASYSKSFELFKKTITSGACTLPPGANTLLPGEGPDDAHLLSPTFTPWSRRLDGALSSFGHTGESLNATQLLRTVDGGYVFSGSGATALSKWSDDGALLWSRTYSAPDEELFIPQLALHRLVPLDDTALLAFANPHHLLKLGQRGGVLWSRAFHVPRGRDGGPYGDGNLQHKILSAVADGEGGAFVGATLDPPSGGPTQAWIFRVDAAGRLRFSKRLSSATTSLFPAAMTRIDGGVVVTGGAWTSENPRWRGWVARLGDDGRLAWSKRWTSDDGEPVEPSNILTTRSGYVTISGRYGGYNRSFLLTLRPDGSEIWRSTPWSGSGLSYLVVDGVAELPTTGFIAVGHYTRDYEASQTFAAGLDAVGRILWLRGYKGSSTLGASKWASVRLSDDGGALIGSCASGSSSGNGSLWLLKARAKDGSVGFSAEATETEDLPYLNGVSALSSADHPVTVTDFSATATPTRVLVTEAKLPVLTQAP